MLKQFAWKDKQSIIQESSNDINFCSLIKSPPFYLCGDYIIKLKKFQCSFAKKVLFRLICTFSEVKMMILWSELVIYVNWQWGICNVLVAREFWTVEHKCCTIQGEIIRLFLELFRNLKKPLFIGVFVIVHMYIKACLLGI